MTEYDFSPMTKAKHVSQERLAEIMARRGGKRMASGSAESPTLGEGAVTKGPDQPSATPVTLEWQERVKGTNYQHDTTGRYTVSASRVDGTYVFSAYFGRNPGSVLGIAQKTAQAAREIAEAHARKGAA
jgi:hypothetical protein